MKNQNVKPTYVQSGHSFSGYFGGKSQLARSIVDLMPEHTTYCEVFAGAGWVLFKKSPSEVEVINDINGDLINLYRVMKYHFDAFITEFEYQLVSRDEYDRFKNQNPNCLTDIQRAAQFYYLLRLAFGTKLVAQSFSSGIARPPRLKLGEQLREHLQQVHARLQQVTIENQDFSKLIKRIDSVDTLFYVDPPYYGCEAQYGKMIFSRDDFIRLKDILSNIKGKFILSLNDIPEVRSIFNDFRLIEKEVRWSVSKTAGKAKDKELLIVNF